MATNCRRALRAALWRMACCMFRQGRLKMHKHKCFRSKHGYGYDEEKPINDNSTDAYAWVNFFFSGFVAEKIPFPLTHRFRSMLQNGIDLSTVDVSYVSSRSWYFLNLFGLSGLFSLILGEENATSDTQRMMQMSGFGFDPTKSLSAEKDSIDIIQHEWALPKSERRAEDALRKLINRRLIHHILGGVNFLVVHIFLLSLSL